MSWNVGTLSSFMLSCCLFKWRLRLNWIFWCSELLLITKVRLRFDKIAMWWTLQKDFFIKPERWVVFVTIQNLIDMVVLDPTAWAIQMCRLLIRLLFAIFQLVCYFLHALVIGQWLTHFTVTIRMLRWGHSEIWSWQSLRVFTVIVIIVESHKDVNVALVVLVHSELVKLFFHFWGSHKSLIIFRHRVH